MNKYDAIANILLLPNTVSTWPGTSGPPRWLAELDRLVYRSWKDDNSTVVSQGIEKGTPNRLPAEILASSWLGIVAKEIRGVLVDEHERRRHDECL